MGGGRPVQSIHSCGEQERATNGLTQLWRQQAPKPQINRLKWALTAKTMWAV